MLTVRMEQNLAGILKVNNVSGKYFYNFQSYPE